jgi:hypothetical protein
VGYPNGPLLRELATRVLANLDYIDTRAPTWNKDSPDRNNPPFTDTQLLISTLGFLVFPHERPPDALGKMLMAFDKEFKLSDVMTIIYPEGKKQVIEIGGPDEKPVVVDPTSIEELPRLLRNSIAHFNVRPLEKHDGRFGGVRIWNTNLDGDITLIADLDFDQLRRLARFILLAFAKGDELLDLDDPPDPVAIVKKQKLRKRNRKAPRVIDDQWEKVLARCGDEQNAKKWIDQTLARALKEPPQKR